MNRRLQVTTFAVWQMCVFSSAVVFGQAKPEPPKTPPAKPSPATAGAATSAKSDSKKAPTQGGVGAPGPSPFKAAPSMEDMNRQASTLIESKKFDEAIAILRQAVTQYPLNIQGYYELGFASSAKGNFADAVNAYRMCVKLNPDNAVYQFNLGRAYVQSGDFASGTIPLGRAIEIDPSQVGWRLVLGDAYIQAKDYSRAGTVLLAALGRAPDSAEVHNSLANLYEQENRHGQALDEYDAALRLNGNDPMTVMFRTSALAGLKRYTEAEAIMRQIVAKDPKDPTAHSYLAQVLDSAGKHDEAIAEYNIALRATPGDAYLWGNLGWAQINGRHFDDAEKSSRKALSIDPKLAYVRLNLGLLFALQDNWLQAQKEYRDAISISAPADLESGIHDLQEAQTKQPTVAALGRAVLMLQDAKFRALGLPE